MSSGHCADNDVKDDFINVKELGLQTLSDSTADDQNRFPTEDLKTRMQVKHQLAGPGKSDEDAAPLRMTKFFASGGEGDIVNFSNVARRLLHFCTCQ